MTQSRSSTSSQLEEEKLMLDDARGILEKLPCPALILDDTMQVVCANVAFYDTYSLSPETFSAQNFFDYCVDPGGVRKEIKNRGIAGNKRSSFVTRFNFSPHETFDVLVECMQNSPAQGFMLFTLSDISEMTRKKRQIVSEKNVLQQLMDNIPDTIYFKDLEGRFTRINKAQARVIGVSHPRDAIGLTDFDFFPREMAEKSFADEQQILAGGDQLIDKEELVTTADGSEIWMSTTKIILRDDNGEASGLVGISRDITFRKQASEILLEAKARAEQSDMLKSAFLANMSHEIRTPMNTIIGFSELLKHSTLTEDERQEYLNYIIDGGVTLLTLIDDIIDFAKIEAGQITIRQHECKVNVLIDEVIATYSKEKERKEKEHIMLVADRPLKGEQFAIQSDYQRIKQVISNLVSNSLKFTDEGSIRVGYTIVDDKLKFFVKDTGIGIPRDKFGIVFERFGQVESSLGRNHRGTGLGLAISKKIVELLGGKMWLESEIGKGTTFFFTIPLVEVDKSPLVLNSEVNDIIPRWDTKVFIVAEDDESCFKFIEAALKDTNAVILRAENGQAVLEMLDQGEITIDLVLTDLKMPDIDGYQLVSQIRHMFGDKLPVVAQTAYAMVGEHQRCLDAGFTDYLSKPIRPRHLLYVLKKHVN